MILGLIAGGWLKGGGTGWSKAGLLVVAGGGLPGGRRRCSTSFGVCPIVKRIWTPAWTLFSGGWCFFAAGRVLHRHRRDGVPDLVVPAAHHRHELHRGLLHRRRPRRQGVHHQHISRPISAPVCSTTWGEAYQDFALGVVLLTVYWLILFWMYRRGIFLRI